MHTHARQIRKEPTRSLFGWLAEPIKDTSGYGMILAQREQERQDALNRSMVKMLSAIILAMLVVLVLA